MDLYYSLILVFVMRCVENVGHIKNKKKNDVESTLKYHPAFDGYLTYARDPGGGPCQVGSLTGAVAS